MDHLIGYKEPERLPPAVMPGEICLDDNIRVRSLKGSDASWVHALVRDNYAFVCRWDVPLSRYTEQRWRDRLSRTDGCLFNEYGVFVNGRLVGQIGLNSSNEDEDTLSYWRVENLESKGIMRRAVGAVVGAGFDELGLERVRAVIHPDNQPSINLIKRLGAQFDIMNALGMFEYVIKEPPRVV